MTDATEGIQVEGLATGRRLAAGADEMLLVAALRAVPAARSGNTATLPNDAQAQRASTRSTITPDWPR